MGISSGTGLVSGLPITTLVDQLIAIEARPRDLLQKQVSSMDSIKAAWMDLSARLLSIKSAAASFDEITTFQAVRATSSNTSVITATAQPGAAQGSYQFTPARLVTNHQVISSGFADADQTPVGAGTMTIELGHGQLNEDTALDLLNGQAGVARGRIKITDRSGSSATIDLTTTTTVREVLDAINRTAGLAVTASVSGDSIVLSDTSGSTSASLKVEEVDAGTTAASLGILGTAGSDVLTGGDVVSINANTGLTILNEGNGVRTAGGNDLQITLEDGTELLVNLSSAQTVGQVISVINAATGNDGKLVAAIDANGDGITLTDTTAGGVGPLTVAAVGTSKAAFDLGLLGGDADGDHRIDGGRLLAGLNTVLLRNLNGGAGVSSGAIFIQDRGAGSATVDLSSVQTVQDVIDAINSADGVAVTASLNSAGNGLVLRDTSGQTLRNFVIAESGGTTAGDLNLLHDAADATADSGHLSHRYVSENSLLDDLGVARGKFVITNSDGQSATIDLTQGNERTLGVVMQEINSRSIGVTATINAAGNGLLLTDTAGGVGKLTVAESGGTTAADLGLLGSDDDGDGMIDGSRRITVTIGATDKLQDVANKISAASGKITATVINDGTTVNPYRLIVSSKVGGVNGRLIIDSGGVPVSFSTMTQPQDALLFLGDPSNPNSIAIRSRTNSVTGVIDGVTLNLVGTSSTPVEVSTSGSIDNVVTQVKAFTAAFNSTIERLDVLTDFDIENNTRGVLQADAVANRIRRQLFSMVTDSARDASGSLSRLSQIGFSVGGNGTEITFDEEKFRQVYASKPADVATLFTQATTGVGDRIDSVLTQMTDSISGSVQRQVDGLDSRRELATKRIAQLNLLLDAKKQRLLRQFLAMEQALASMQTQSTALTGMATAMASMASVGGGGMQM